MAPRVVVVGSVNLDLVAHCERLPRPGETVTDATFARVPGGKGANQAVACARLGAEVTMVAAVGPDPFADEALAGLREAGVELRLEFADGPTGVALIVVDAEGENEIVVAVWDPTDAGYQPRGKQVRKPEGIWYTAVTGIWQTVWLEPVPARAIESLEIVPDVDRSAARITVTAPTGTRVRLAASKGGVASLTLPMARELAQHGIRVVAVAPGVFETPMVAGMSEKVRESLRQQTVFPPRLGQPDEFAALVQHVIENPMLNGCVLRRLSISPR